MSARPTAPPALTLKGPIALGDLLGSIVYLGRCWWCGVQFMSRLDSVYYDLARLMCRGCGEQSRKASAE